MKKRKNLVIVCLVLAVLCLSVAYAAFATTLTINGTATINESDWDVEITNIVVKDSTGNADGGSPTYTKTSATFNAALKTPGDSVTYEVTITNKGSTTATFDNQTWTYNGNAPVTYSVPADIVFTQLAQNDTVTFEVVATYDASSTAVIDSSNNTKTATGTIKYVSAS